jgi:N-acetyl-anhydromuramyl-L-alanine amidase AmpD
MNINTITWNKLTKYPPHIFKDPLTRGYAGQRNSPKSIVIHTTNGAVGTSFGSEAKYIRDSKKISAHYLVGKEYEIAQILDPSWIAYHTGPIWAAYKLFGNPYSIGIECHHTPGETWTFEQKRALFDLCRMLCSRYQIKLIETHRKIAKPQGRKVDPSDFSDSDFYAFVKRIFHDNVPEDYITNFNCNVRNEPNTEASILHVIPKGTKINVADFVDGEKYRGNNQWALLVDGGYIWKDLLRVA